MDRNRPGSESDWFVTRRMTVVLNILLAAAYVAISFLASKVWIMLAGFVALNGVVRCATLLWMAGRAGRETGEPVMSSVPLVVSQLVISFLVAAVLGVVSWWLVRLWPSGGKLITLGVALVVVYKSTFPAPRPAHLPHHVPRPLLLLERMLSGVASHSCPLAHLHRRGVLLLTYSPDRHSPPRSLAIRCMFSMVRRRRRPAHVGHQ